MKSNEYQELDQVDRRHWFYCGKREIVRHWIDRFTALDRQDLLVDAGMGTGTWLLEMASRCQVLGVDDHEESLALAAPKIAAAGGRVLKSSLTQIELPSGGAKVVTAMDVLEHIDDDARALGELCRLLQPGGLLVITVPAFQWLWSDWDEVVEHRRRYHKPQLLALLNRPDMQLLRCAYFNTFLLPPIALVRGWRRIRPLRNPADRMEHRVPGPMLNGLLKALMVYPACSRFFPSPAGVSLLAVARKVA